MKKLLVVFSAVLVAGLTTASAVDRSGKFALGFQEQLTDNAFGGTTGNSQGSWSVKYGFAPSVTAQLIVGFDAGKEINKKFNVGARALFDLVENENSDFYSGLGVVYIQQDETAKVVRANIPLGFEFNFAGLPEVGISAEAGLNVDFETNDAADKALSINSVGGKVGGNLGLGVHYYF